ncbi:MAG: imidazole glycerol phosphate synthase subunit HisH [Pirellulaceae bacterium]|nr:MAG: imidazole glycerol phosphate synthase subunit HisH [Pirellulaceae bacterium]
MDRMIAIVDYQMGNLRSVQKAFERLGTAAVISSDPVEVLEADAVVLPGVGAFADAMAELQRRGLVEALKQYIATDRPFLGICLGLQLLFDYSYEDGKHRGLGVLPGEVVRFPSDKGLKIPHMGWNQVQRRFEDPILDGIPDGSFFYFVHSYYAVPEDRSVVLLESDYGGPFCAMVRRGNLYATQFHPEKSQVRGLRLLRNFVALVESNALSRR